MIHEVNKPDNEAILSNQRIVSNQGILRPFFKFSWKFYAAALAVHAAASAIFACFPVVLGEFTDFLERGGMTQNDVVRYSLMLLTVGAGHALLAGIGQFTVMYMGRRFEFMTRRRLFAHLSEMSEQFFSRNGVGKLLSYFMNDVTGVREAISMGINQLMMASLLLISSVGAMLMSGIPLYLIAASVGPLLLIPLVVTRLGPVIRSRSLKVQESLGVMTEAAEEQFRGIRVTKKFAVEPIMIERFGRHADEIQANQLALVRVSSVFQALVPFLGALSMITALAYGGYLTISGRISLGDFVALTFYIRMLMNPLQQIGNVINVMQRSRAAWKRLNDLIGVQPDIVEADDALPVRLHNDAVRVKGLSFAYPGSSREVLQDINLTIEPGATVGIIGRTGSGKTTLIKLLMRMYDPPEGTVFIGETDIRRASLDSLRDQIAYVPQDGFLFSTTIRDNIAFARRDASREEIEDAARQARIYDNIVRFPDGFLTRLGERGLTLSGGQRQRTSLARGLLKQAPLIILDDSVSAVDAVTETEIIRSLQEERRGKTTIIIAHRISALKHADLILVMDKGRIVQRGRHEELIAQPGLYADFYAIQEEGKRHAAGHS